MIRCLNYLNSMRNMVYKKNQNLSSRNNVHYYILKQWRALMARADWLVKLRISCVSIYTLSDLGVLSNLIGSLSLANEHYSPPTEWIMRKPNKNKMASVNSRFASVSESIFNGFLLKMLLRSLPVYILKQLFFSILLNSGRIFTEPRSGEVNILPLFTSISKNNC